MTVCLPLHVRYVRTFFRAVRSFCSPADMMALAEVRREPVLISPLACIVFDEDYNRNNEKLIRMIFIFFLCTTILLLF